MCWNSDITCSLAAPGEAVRDMSGGIAHDTPFVGILCVISLTRIEEPA